MAPKNKDEKGNSSNRIRFIMLDADISDGNLTDLTHAITSALRPSGQMRQLPSRPRVQAILTADETADVPEDSEEPVDTELEDNGDENAAPRVARAKTKPSLPKYLHDLDVTGNGTPFKEYAEKKAPKKQVKRYLVAAMWLKEHGNTETINIDKVYTLYKTVGWPLGITDWDANFRQAVKRDLMRRVSPGEYAITPIGEGALQKAEE